MLIVDYDSCEFKKKNENTILDSQLFVCQEVTAIFVQPTFYMKPQNFSQMSQISRACYQMTVGCTKTPDIW